MSLTSDPAFRDAVAALVDHYASDIRARATVDNADALDQAGHVTAAEFLRDTLEDSNLVAHARRELELLGETDASFVESIVGAVRAFASGGHSGGSAGIAIQYLERLLRFQNLSPLTNDPTEWVDRTEISGYPCWQSLRNGEAFSEDGGKTYYLLSERRGKNGSAPMHTAASTATDEAVTS